MIGQSYNNQIQGNKTQDLRASVHQLRHPSRLETRPHRQAHQLTRSHPLFLLVAQRRQLPNRQLICSDQNRLQLLHLHQGFSVKPQSPLNHPALHPRSHRPVCLVQPNLKMRPNLLLSHLVENRHLQETLALETP